jgi:hypothetical protein
MSRRIVDLRLLTIDDALGQGKPLDTENRDVGKSENTRKRREDSRFASDCCGKRLDDRHITYPETEERATRRLSRRASIWWLLRVRVTPSKRSRWT